MDQNLNVSAVPLEQPPTWLKTFFRVCGVGHVIGALISIAGIIIPLVISSMFSGAQGTNDIFTILSVFLKGSVTSFVVSVVLAYGYFKMRKWVIPGSILNLASSLLLSMFVAQSLVQASGPAVPRINLFTLVVVAVIVITIIYRKHLTGEYFSLIPLVIVVVALAYSAYFVINFANTIPAVFKDVPGMKFGQPNKMKL